MARDGIVTGISVRKLGDLADLILTIVMHFKGNSNFAGIFFLATIIAGILLGLAG
jgi:hypothetical protein